MKQTEGQAEVSANGRASAQSEADQPTMATVQWDDSRMVELTDRVILSPHATKRLSIALSGVIKEYEARHGALKVDGR